MNKQCKKAGLTFFNHDNTYAVLSDAPLSYRAKPSYTPTDAKSVVICVPHSISFRDINKATSRFGTFTFIQPLESNPSAKSHQYFEALFQNLGSSILAHQGKVQGITFTSGSPNLLKKQNIIYSIVKDHATSKWEATLLAAIDRGQTSMTPHPPTLFLSSSSQCLHYVTTQRCGFPSSSLLSIPRV